MKGEKVFSETAERIVAAIFFELRSRKDLFHDTLCSEAVQRDIRESCLRIVEEKLDEVRDLYMT